MQKINKIPTEQELYQKFSARCSLTEYVPFDIEQKAMQAGASREIAERIVDRLIDENFINEERYIRAFVHDKFTLSHWGRIKITAALRMKRINSKLINAELETISQDQYKEVLLNLLTAKNRHIKASSNQERTRKLLSFAVSRGFEAHLAYDAIEQLDISTEE